MANIKSAKKRIDVAERNRKRNVYAKSTVRTAIRRVNEAIEALNTKEGNAEQLNKALSLVFSLLDRAVLKGIYHKNTGARYKSRLTKRAKIALGA